MSNKKTGDLGEKEIIKRVPCPNCKKKLMLLPPNYPLWKKANQNIILGAVGIFSLAWFILKYLFKNNKEE